MTSFLQDADDHAAGDHGAPRDAVERWFVALYPRLQRIAMSQLHSERRDHTLQPTGLVHELYIRFIVAERLTFVDRAHFLRAAARGMRHILVDHARSRRRVKRDLGTLQRHVPFLATFEEPQSIELLALNEVLERFGALFPEELSLVELRHFAGLTEEEAATVLGVSTRTIRRRWEFSRSWIYRELHSGGTP